MDVRLRLLLLVLLAYISSAWSKNTRNGPIPHLKYRQYHRHYHQLYRQVRALSEFLLPPPVPTNIHMPYPPLSIQHQQKNYNQSPSRLPSHTPSAQEGHLRNGRYMNQQKPDSNNSPDYFSKLMNWLNPFSGNAHYNVIGKNSHGQGLLNNLKQQDQIGQYAPHQPYTSEISQYDTPPHPINLHNEHRNVINGKPCNSCNQIPWMPIFHDNVHYNLGRYAANSGSNNYLAPPSLEEIKAQDFSHSGSAELGLNSQQNYPTANSYLHPSMVSSVFKAKPSNDIILENFPPNAIPSIALNKNNPSLNIPNPSSLNFEHILSQNVDHSLPETFNSPSTDLNYQQPYELHHSSINFNEKSPPDFNYELADNFAHSATSIKVDHLPNERIHNASTSNFNHPTSISNISPIKFNEQSLENFKSHAPPSLDHELSLHAQYKLSSNINKQSSTLDDEQQHLSNFEQYHEPSQIFSIINKSPADLENSQINNHQEPDHAESRPVFINSDRSNTALNNTIINENDQRSSDDSFYHSKITRKIPDQEQQQLQNGKSVHFQRSPLIDLSVAGELSTEKPTYYFSKEWSTRLKNATTEEPAMVAPLKGKFINNNSGFSTPSTILIDYILSSPDQTFDSSRIEKETRSPTQPQHQSERIIVPLRKTTITSTTQRTAAVSLNQRQQETLIKTIVQSYGFFKMNNETRANEGELEGRIFNDTNDFSASKEITMPNKEEHESKNKQIIQIIIPYTSQYTPSPFQSTRSINNSLKKTNPITCNCSGTEKPLQGTSISRVASADDNVEDNIVIQESRRVSVTRNAPERKLSNNRTNIPENRGGHTIDVHRLQKNIDNWTIQEYSKQMSSLTNYLNSTHPRWISSKQIPDEYLQPIAESEENDYDFNNDTGFQQEISKLKESSIVENSTKVNIINATYPKNERKTEHVLKSRSNNTNSKSDNFEHVYVVTPIPNPNSIENISLNKDREFWTRNPKVKQENSMSIVQAYQVLPQAVNNLAVLSSAPNSAAPALWGIMEHEELASSANQPRWRSESDVLPVPPSTPILYAGHSKVSRAS